MRQKTKTLDITGFRECLDEDIVKTIPEGSTIEVVIRRISFGEKNDLLDEVTNVTIKGRQTTAKPQYGRLRTLTLAKAIVSAPFPVTIDYIQKELDETLGEYIFTEIDQLGKVSVEKKEQSNDVGTEQEATQNSTDT